MSLVRLQAQRATICQSTCLQRLLHTCSHEGFGKYPFWFKKTSALCGKKVPLIIWAINVSSSRNCWGRYGRNSFLAICAWMSRILPTRRQMSVQLAFLCIFEPELVLMMQDTLHIVVQLLTHSLCLPKTVFCWEFWQHQKETGQNPRLECIGTLSCRVGAFFLSLGPPYTRLIVTFQEQVGYHCCWIPLVWFYGTTKFVEQTGGQSWDSFNALWIWSSIGQVWPSSG